MYPEDQDKEQQPANRNVMGAAPQPFEFGQPLQQQSSKQPSKKSGRKKLLLWVISCIVTIFIVLLAALVVLAPGSKNTSKQSGNNTADTTGQTDDTSGAASTAQCDAKLRRYQNQDLDIRFCYPNAWGDVKVADGKFDPSDTGTRVRLSFANKDQVHLGLVSDDWSTDVARDGTCVDPSAQTFPDTSTFSAKWITEEVGGQVSTAVRGLEVVPDQYLLQERTDDLLTSGVCIEGYQAFGGKVYRNAEVTYYASFTAAAPTPKAHIVEPTILVPVADRTDFTAFVKSIEDF